MRLAKYARYVALCARIDLYKFKKPRLVAAAFTMGVLICVIVVLQVTTIYLLRMIDSYHNTEWSTSFDTRSGLRFPRVYACTLDGSLEVPPVGVCRFYYNFPDLSRWLSCDRDTSFSSPPAPSRHPGMCVGYLLYSDDSGDTQAEKEARAVYSHARGVSQALRIQTKPPPFQESKNIAMPPLAGTHFIVASHDSSSSSSELIEFLVPPSNFLRVSLEAREVTDLDGNTRSSYLTRASEVSYKGDYQGFGRPPVPVNDSWVTFQFSSMEVTASREFVAQDWRWLVASLGAVGIIGAYLLRGLFQIWLLVVFDDTKLVALQAALAKGDPALIRAVIRGFHAYVLEKLQTGRLLAMDKVRRASVSVYFRGSPVQGLETSRTTGNLVLVSPRGPGTGSVHASPRGSWQQKGSTPSSPLSRGASVPAFFQDDTTWDPSHQDAQSNNTSNRTTTKGTTVPRVTSSRAHGGTISQHTSSPSETTTSEDTSQGHASADEASPSPAGTPPSEIPPLQPK